MPKANRSREKKARSGAAAGGGRGDPDYRLEKTFGNPRKHPDGASYPGWTASGTGSETIDELRRRRGTREYSGGLGTYRATNSWIRESRGGVTDTQRALGGELDSVETVKPPAPAAMAKQSAVYEDDSDDEPPPL
jgi:hypothetical protein